MIRRILEDGQPVREVARGFDISERTARGWLARYRAEGPNGLENRSSCPRTVANRTSEYWLAVTERLRREYRLTTEEIAGKLRLARSTVAACSPGVAWVAWWPWSRSSRPCAISASTLAS
jgi:transposase